MKKLLLFLSILVPTITSASGIEVTPSKLELKVTSTNSASATLTIANPTADVQVFEIYPDDFAEIILASPQSFTLESGVRKVVTITVKPNKDGKASQILQTNLSILAKPLADSRFQANTGVKVSLSITSVKDKSPEPLPRWIFYAYVAAAVAGFSIFFFKTRKKTLA